MNILFLTNYYPPHHMGGYEELCADVAEGLRERGHTVSVLTSNVGASGESPRSVFRLLHPEVNSHPYGPTVNFFVGRASRLTHDLRAMERLITELSPDVILVWGMWNLRRQLAMYLEQRAQPPVAYYIADYWPSLPDAYTLHWRAPSRRGITSAPKWLVARLALTMLRAENMPNLRFQHVMCVSQAVRNRLVESGLPLSQASVIYNGIHLDEFRQVKRLQTISPASLLYAGRLSPDKGVETAIRAVSQLVALNHNAHLTIVGAGNAEYVVTLQQLAQELNIRNQVSFAGRVPRTKMPHVLSQHDVLLVPSTWPEPLPRIAQEGMASGMVVVSSNVGGLPEIVQHDMNGLTFEAGDAQALSAQLLRLFDEPTLAPRLVRQAQQTVAQHFDINRTVDEVARFLQGIIKTSI